MANKEVVRRHTAIQEDRLSDRIERAREQGKTVEIIERYTTHPDEGAYERTRGIMGEALYARVLVTVDGIKKRWRYDSSKDRWV